MNIYTIEECNKWKHNKNINPKTNRIIKIGAATYNEIEKECKSYNISSIFSNFCKNNNNIKSNNSLNSIEKKIYHKFNIFCNDIKKDKKSDKKDDIKSDIKSDIKKDKKSDIKDDIKKDKKSDIKKDKKTDIKKDKKSDIKTDIKSDIKKDKKADIKKDKKRDKKADIKADIKSDIKKDKKSDIKDDIKSDIKKIDLTQFIDKNVKIKSFTDYEKDYIEYLKKHNYDKYIDYVKEKEPEEEKEDFNSKNCITLIPKKEEQVKYSLFNLFQKPKISYNYLLMNNIKLYKPFGKQTENSIIYKAKNIIKKNKFLIKIKLQQTETNNELELFKELSFNANKKNIQHIPLYYNYTICDKIIRKNEYPNILSNAKYNYKYYSLLLFENAEDNLSSFINDYSIDKNMWKNIYEQTYISIFILHSMGYIHNNINGSNFLYRIIEKGGCFHYKINGEDYYIENMGLIWMIWNFEKCEKIETKVKYWFLYDYYQLNIELSHRDYELEKKSNFLNDIKNPLNTDKGKKISGKLNDDIKLSSNIKNIQNKLWQMFLINNNNNIIKEAAKGNIDSSKFIKLLCDENLLFSKTPIGKVIYSTTI
jgi:hypothetical protein